MPTIDLNLDLWPKQALAYETKATELLFGGATRGGKSWMVRAALVSWCIEIPNLQCTLIRKKYQDILDNHVYGMGGFRHMLAPLIAIGKVIVTNEVVKFWNESRIIFKHCFTGDTQVLTTDGPKPIASLVNERGYVTIAPGVRASFRNVRRTRTNAELVRVIFDDGSEYRCTPDHRFITAEGVCEAQYLLGKRCLTNGSSLSTILTNSSGLRSTSSSKDDTLAAAPTDFIAWCGSITEALFRPAWRFITGTRTELTTSSRTWSYSTAPSIALYTPQLSRHERRRVSASPWAASLRRFGTQALPGASGISSSTSASRTSCTPAPPASALTVASLTSQGTPGSTAPKSVGKLSTRLTEGIKLRESVPSAERPTSRASIDARRPAGASADEPCQAIRCVGVVPAGNADVYCLTVPDFGFFPLANGVLVSNCQDLRQAESAQGIPSNVLVIDEATQIPEGLLKAFRAWCTMSEEQKASLPAHHKGRFPRIIYTANPIGSSVGYFRRQFVKARSATTIEHVDGFWRQYIPSRVEDNPSEDATATRGRVAGMHDSATARALLEGDWDAPVGEFFPEWDESRHVIPDHEPPAHLFRFRSFDWGTAEPFCVLWWAVSDGEPFTDPTTKHRHWYPRGALIAYREWYGCDPENPAAGNRMRNEEIAHGILARSPHPSERRIATITDSLPFQDRGGVTIAETFAENGVLLTLADVSRVPGWSQMRSRLIGIKVDSNDRERTPLIFFTESCRYTRDYIPSLPRHPSENKREDAAEHGEATHACDTVRLACLARPTVTDAPPRDPDPAHVKGIAQATFDQVINRHFERRRSERDGGW